MECAQLYTNQMFLKGVLSHHMYIPMACLLLLQSLLSTPNVLLLLKAIVVSPFLQLVVYMLSLQIFLDPSFLVLLILGQYSSWVYSQFCLLLLHHQYIFDIIIFCIIFLYIHHTFCSGTVHRDSSQFCLFVDLRISTQTQCVFQNIIETYKFFHKNPVWL